MRFWLGGSVLWSDSIGETPFGKPFAICPDMNHYLRRIEEGCLTRRDLGYIQKANKQDAKKTYLIIGGRDILQSKHGDD